MSLAALVVFVVTLAAFASAIGLMMLGSRLTGRCLHGSCGGPEVLGPDGEPLSCERCPNRPR
jgi:hypothetical protein